MRETLKAYAPLEYVKDLEGHLTQLARKVGVRTEIQVRRLIRRRKKKIADIPDKEVEEVVRTIVLPMMYRLNNQMRATAESGACDLAR